MGQLMTTVSSFENVKLVSSQCATGTLAEDEVCDSYWVTHAVTCIHLAHIHTLAFYGSFPREPWLAVCRLDFLLGVVQTENLWDKWQRMCSCHSSIKALTNDHGTEWNSVHWPSHRKSANDLILFWSTSDSWYIHIKRHKLWNECEALAQGD